MAIGCRLPTETTTESRRSTALQVNIPVKDMALFGLYSRRQFLPAITIVPFRFSQ